MKPGIYTIYITVKGSDEETGPGLVVVLGDKTFCGASHDYNLVFTGVVTEETDYRGHVEVTISDHKKRLTWDAPEPPKSILRLHGHIGIDSFTVGHEERDESLGLMAEGHKIGDLE